MMLFLAGDLPLIMTLTHLCNEVMEHMNRVNSANNLQNPMHTSAIFHSAGSIPGLINLRQALLSLRPLYYSLLGIFHYR